MDKQAEEKLFEILERAAQGIAGGDLARAEADLEQAVLFLKSTPDAQGVMYARAYLLQGRVAEARSDLGRAAAFYEQVLALLEQSSPTLSVLLAGTTRLLSEIRVRQNDRDAAARLRRRAREVIAKALAAGEPGSAAQAADLVETEAKIDPREAESTYQQALTLLRTSPHTRGLLTLLTRRAVYCDQAGRPEEAEAATLEALETLNALSRADLSDEADSLIPLAEMCERLGRDDDALRVYELVGDEKNALGVGAPEYYTALLRQARIRCGRGDHDSAEKLYLKAGRVGAEVYGRESVWVAKAAHELAGCHRHHHRYSDAVDWYKSAGELWRAHFGDLDLRYAEALNGVAFSYDHLAVYAEAERYYNQALYVYETVLGRSHEETVIALYNLAELSRVQNDHALAEQRFLEALSIEQEARGHATATHALILNNLGDLYTALGRYTEAEEFLDRALAMRLELHGPESEPYARSLHSIASLRAERGDYEAAREASGRARAIVEQAGLQRDVAEMDMFSATMALEHQGGTPETLALLQSALEGILKFYDEHHPLAVSLRRHIAYCLTQQRDWKAAREQLNQALLGEDVGLIEYLISGARQQVARHLKTLRNFQALYLSLVLHDPSHGKDDLETAYGIVQRRKGMETRTLRLLKPGADNYEVVTPDWNASAYSRITTELDRLRKKLNRLRLQGDQAAGGGRAADDIITVQRQVSELEKSLALKTQTGKFDLEMLGISSDSVSYALEENSVLVEYVYVPDWVAMLDESQETRRYVAFVIRPRTDDALRLYDLGNAAQIDAAVEEMHAALVDYLPGETNGTPSWLKKARFLYNRLLRPLAAELGGVRHIIISPDGALSTLPFELLQDAGGNLLVDQYTFSHLLVGSEATRLRGPFGLKGAPLVIAAPDYNLTAARGDGEADTGPTGGDDQRIDALRRAGRFADLPNALAEGESVARKLGLEVTTGAAATESVLKQSEFPEIIHIATHGFYLTRALPPDAETQAVGLSSGDLLQRRTYLDDPLERTGLVMAGVNSFLNGQSVPSQAEDGILFASEIVDLDLRRTDLVVLAACQTGQGDVRLGEGVLGLRQAFNAAGCRSVVSALWSIPDERELMELFYDELLKGASRADALYAAKRAVRQRHPDDPVYWGGIILDGDHGPLRRFAPSSRIKVASLSGKDWGLDKTPEEVEEEKSRFTPAQKARALFDRGMAHLQAGQDEEAVRDFTSVLAFEGAPPGLYARALYERAGLHRKNDGVEAALADYDRLLALPRIPQRIHLSAFYDRATTHIRRGDFAAAIADYTHVVQSKDIPTSDRVMALLNRGYSHWGLKDYAAAINDFTTIIGMKGGPGDQRFKALLNRANVYADMGDDQSAIEDTTRALELAEGGAEDMRNARYFRALRYLRAGDTQSAVADLNVLLSEPEWPDEWVARWLLTRARAYARQGDDTKARADSQAILSRPAIDPEIAKAARQILSGEDESAGAQD